MPAKIISTATAEHYKWGGPAGTDCDGWYLVSTPDLNVIEELMPPGTAETRHYHRHARQFFYVLAGELTLEVEHHDFVLRAGQGLEIAPGQRTRPSIEAPERLASLSPASHRATATASTRSYGKPLLRREQKIQYLYRWWEQIVRDHLPATEAISGPSPILDISGKFVWLR